MGEISPSRCIDSDSVGSFRSSVSESDSDEAPDTPLLKGASLLVQSTFCYGLWAASVGVGGLLGVTMLMVGYGNTELSTAYEAIQILGILHLTMAGVASILLCLSSYGWQWLQLSLITLNVLLVGLGFGGIGFCGHYLGARFHFLHEGYMMSWDVEINRRHYSVDDVAFFNREHGALLACGCLNLIFLVLLLRTSTSRNDSSSLEKALLYIPTLCLGAFAGGVAILTTKLIESSSIGGVWLGLVMLQLLFLTIGDYWRPGFCCIATGVVFLFMAIFGAVNTGLYFNWFVQGRKISSTLLGATSASEVMPEQDRSVYLLYELMGAGSYQFFMAAIGAGVFFISSLACAHAFHSFKLHSQEQLQLAQMDVVATTSKEKSVLGLEADQASIAREDTEDVSREDTEDVSENGSSTIEAMEEV